MTIKELKAEDKAYIKELALLHRDAFPHFFLTQLGLPFLRTLYKGYLEDGNSGIIIAEEEGKAIGLLAYSKDYPNFYRGLIKRRIVQFAWCSFLAVLRHPSFAKRLLFAFKKSDSVEKSERYVELSSICVAPGSAGRGIGTKLIDHLKSIIDFKAYAYINLETDADDNESANRFYQKNGFTLAREYTTNEGRRMNEYHYAPGAFQ